jgi:hypothetical protein
VGARDSVPRAFRQCMMARPGTAVNVTAGAVYVTVVDNGTEGVNVTVVVSSTGTVNSTGAVDTSSNGCDQLDGHGRGSTAGNGTVPAAGNATAPTKQGHSARARRGSLCSPTCGLLHPCVMHDELIAAIQKESRFFFNRWNLYTGADPMNGTVQFVDRSTAGCRPEPSVVSRAEHAQRWHRSRTARRRLRRVEGTGRARSMCGSGEDFFFSFLVNAASWAINSVSVYT